VAGRTLLRPDVAGQYTVVATVTTTTGTTNLSQTLTAGTYMGINTCTLCHSGGQSAPDMVQPWSLTEHATMFSRGIDGLVSSHYSKSCIQCHTLGYDTNALAVNGGFDDVAAQLGWVFPAVLNTNNWASMQTNYPTLANLANIQCENCHGPGSQHAYSLGNTNLIAVNFSSGDCAQCHDDPPGHVYVAEWNNSVHAITTRDPAGNASCVGCHTAYGFIGRIEGALTTNTAYAPINCQTCHEPHGATLPATNAPNSHIIRSWMAPSLRMPEKVSCACNVITPGRTRRLTRQPPEAAPILGRMKDRNPTCLRASTVSTTVKPFPVRLMPMPFPTPVLPVICKLLPRRTRPISTPEATPLK
jgi:hypothetical protein